MSPATDPDLLYSITDLARELAITPRAIRYYESKNLLTPQRAGANRIYTHRDRARLLIILRIVIDRAAGIVNVTRPVDASSTDRRVRGDGLAIKKCGSGSKNANSRDLAVCR